MATAIFFNGRRINIPGAFSRIDASALASTSPSAVGIVALIGEAEGGEPLTVDESVSDMTRGGQIIDKFRSGPLKTASSFAFEPSTDEAIPGGAQRIVAVKVNPATQSTVTLADDLAADSVDLTSVDYGLFTTQINIEVAAGTTQGKLITVVFEDTTETFDDVGGDTAMTVAYAPGADGYDTMLGTLDATNFTALATKLELDLTAEITDANPAGLPAAVEVVSANAGDTTQTVTIYGLGAGSVAQQETVTLNGVTPVPTTVFTDWIKVLGVAITGTTAGIVTVDDGAAGVIATLAAGANTTAGIVQTTNTPAAGVLTITGGADAAEDVAIFGLDAAGAPVGERFDMTSAATTPVVGTQVFSAIQVMALGDDGGLILSASISVNAAQTAHSAFATVQRVTDRLNSLDGFTATASVTNPTTFLMTDMDFVSAVDLTGAGGAFLADLFAFIDKLESESQFVSAARATGASAVPANTTAAVFLAGGIEGVTTITQWQAAFDLLRGRRVNIIVPLTSDAAVHALLATHLVDRAGTLRSEANGYIGIGTAADAGDTLANIKSRIQTIQTRHISALIQEPERFDPDDGLATFYPPFQLAAIAAGMQAGSPIGEPLTRKRPLVTDLRNDSSWSVENDIESLIDSGAMVAEKVDGVGIRFVRSITTYLADDNVVFSEMSANESANTAVFELRTSLEAKIGQRGLIGTVAALKGLANDRLGKLIDDEIIFAFRNLQVEQVGDVFPISVEIAPILPINFIPITVHLVAARAAA
jgi:hypothetical protein